MDIAFILIVASFFASTAAFLAFADSMKGS